jgi:hypothetical protein
LQIAFKDAIKLGVPTCDLKGNLLQLDTLPFKFIETVV